MIEIGGYWAYYSLWFLRGGDRRRSIVVEPDPANLEVGRRNAALNGLSPEFLAGFMGARPGSSQPFETENSGLVDLPCLSVPQLLAERGIDHLSLLHCDAQGAELAVLKSCSELLRHRAIDWIFISTHAHQITGDPLTHQRCINLVRGLGGTVVTEHEVHKSFSGDGLIVAWFGEGEPNLPPTNITRNRYSESMFRNPLYEVAVADGRAARAEAAAAVAETAQASAEARATEALAARETAEGARGTAEATAAEASAAREAAEAARATAEATTAEALAARMAAEAARATAEATAAEALAARMAAEAARATAEATTAEALAARMAAEAAHAAIRHEAEMLRQSTSWRATAPLRLVSDLLRRPWR